MRYNLTLSSDENDNITINLIDNITKEEKTVGYLSVFRNYRIQISMTPDGVGDLGSSRVLPYLSDICRNMDIEVARAFVQSQITEAIMMYQRTSYFVNDTHHLGAAILPKMDDLRQLDKVATRFLGELIGDKEVNTYYC